MLCTQEYKAHFIVEAVKTFSILISIFLLHFDIRLLDFVVLAYPTKDRLTIGNSRIDLPLTQRNLLFRIPSQNFEEDIISS